MTCPNCRTDNPAGAKFCFNCGTAMPIACAHCGTPLAPNAKFCFNCGQPVAAASPTGASPGLAPGAAPVAPPSPSPVAEPGSSLARLQQYIPKELLAKLENARATRSMEGERRIVTVLFCDVKGSTAMAETLDPEEWAEIMNGAFKFLIEPVYRYEGTLARLMGDAILAFFGAPIGHEDDPQRAVLAALDIVEGIRPYSEQVRRQRGFELNVRIGINTGLVVVGEVGSDLRVEYTAMGDAVNVASRMEQAAEPGTVLISGNTHKSVARLFDFVPLGGIEIKGKAEHVEAYRVTGKREGAVQTRGIEGLSSPLVGRDRELQVLRSRVEELLAGRGQLVSLIGEAGLGKSRLMAELRKSAQTAEAAEPSGLAWYEGRSLSYETSTPYAPFVSLLTGLFGPSADQSDEEKYGALKTRVGEISPGRADEIAPFVGTVFDLKLPADDLERVRYLEPPMLRGATFRAIHALVEDLASASPVALVFEDLHWADPTSLELLEQLLPITDRAPLMIVALFRPQRQEPSWRFHEIAARDFGHRYTQVALEPLDEANARTLVANLLEIEDLPERVRALILRKAEGNPFFVEEVIRSLLDARLVVREDGHWRATREIENVAVPDTLAGVITARLDRLDDESRHVAQTASVIGREFEFDALSVVYEAPPVLDDALGTLQRRELVRERSRLPHRAYLFKHVLTQETAYASILLSRRRELHLRVAECLERLAPDHVNDIARHYLEARQEERALPYLVEAGDRAIRAASREEALTHYGRAVDIVQRVQDPGTFRVLARRAYEGLGKALEFSQNVPGVMENYQAMHRYAETHGDVPMRVSALNKIAYATAFMMGDFPEAEKHLGGSELLARQVKDSAGLAELYTLKCAMCTMVADFSNADRYLTEAVELGRQLDQNEQMAYGLAHKSNTLTYMARFEDAWRTGQEGLQVSEEAGNLERRAEILGFAATFYYLHKGNLEAACASAEEGFNLAARIGAPIPSIVGSYAVASIAHLRGEYEIAVEWYRRSEQMARAISDAFPFLLPMSLTGQAMVDLDISPSLAERSAGQRREALQIMETPMGAPGGGLVWADLGFYALSEGETDKAREYFQNGLNAPSVHMYLQRPRLLVGSALAALVQGQVTEAAKLLADARAYAEEREMVYFYPLIEATDARVRTAGGDLDRALERYSRAEALAEEMGMLPMLLEARQGAARTLSSLGRAAESETKQREARATVDEIVALFKDADNRTMYLENVKI
jgi:class 3 adenylate cyclase/tetratricopeptide (TPR) repeat protein